MIVVYALMVLLVIMLFTTIKVVCGLIDFMDPLITFNDFMEWLFNMPGEGRGFFFGWGEFLF